MVLNGMLDTDINKWYVNINGMLDTIHNINGMLDTIYVRNGMLDDLWVLIFTIQQ